MADTCGTCAYSSWPYVYNYPDQHPEDNGYKCRKRAPLPTGGQMSPAWTMWPRVLITDWCGDYVADLNRDNILQRRSEADCIPEIDDGHQT